jgi:hypothetical protein
MGWLQTKKTALDRGYQLKYEPPHNLYHRYVLYNEKGEFIIAMKRNTAFFTKEALEVELWKYAYKYSRIKSDFDCLKSPMYKWRD